MIYSRQRQVNKLLEEAEARYPVTPCPAPEYVAPTHDAEQLARFLAIDDSQLPCYNDAPVVDGYHLYATYYRSDRWCVLHHIEQDHVTVEDMSKVARWVETFGEQACYTELIKR